MRGFIPATLLTMALVLSCAIHAETRRALVIGNNAYPGNALENAKNDATSVYDALKAEGYLTTLVLDADRTTLSRKVDDFVDTIHDGDTALLYYAGHGMQIDGENYLVPVDFKVSTEESGKEQAYPLDSVLERFTGHGAKTQVVILDACRDNPFLGTRSVKGGWAGLGTSAGAFLAFGTSPGSTASDAPDLGHGLFTKSLLKYLTSSDLDIEEMFRKVRESVIRDSGGKQVPWVSSSLIGSFHVRPELDAAAPDLTPVSERIDTNEQTARSLENPPQQASSASGEKRPIGLNDSTLQVSNLIRGEKMDAAISTLKTLVAANPLSGGAFRILGLLLHSSGRNVEAIQSLDRAIRIDGDDSRALAYKCAIESEAELSTADGDCASMLHDQPSSDAYLLSAARSLDQSQFSKAYQEASQAISMGGSDLAFAVRGMIASRDGKQAPARRDFSRAVQLSIENTTP